MSELNQIEEISKLYAEPKSYQIHKELKEGQKQATIKIMPLGLKDMSLMSMKEDSPISEVSKNVISLWAISLQIKEEEAEKISVEFMQELMDSFMDANNFKEEDLKKTGIKDFIKNKQEQIKTKEENAESDRKA